MMMLGAVLTVVVIYYFVKPQNLGRDIAIAVHGYKRAKKLIGDGHNPRNFKL